jgi:hypothetical protein
MLSFKPLPRGLDYQRLNSRCVAVYLDGVRVGSILMKDWGHGEQWAYVAAGYTRRCGEPFNTIEAVKATLRSD